MLIPRISQKLTNILPNDSVLAVCHLILLLFPPKQQLFGQKSRKPKPVQIQDEPMSHATQIHYVSEELKTKTKKLSLLIFHTFKVLLKETEYRYFYFSKRRKLFNLTLI